MSYDALEMTKPKKGGRPAWKEREGDRRVVYVMNLYESQREWLKTLPNGGADWLRRQIDKAMRRG